MLINEQRQSGITYKCPSGQYDDLDMSLAMLAWRPAPASEPVGSSQSSSPPAATAAERSQLAIFRLTIQEFSRVA